ncbi:MAG TPA: hypothetical protein DGG95_12285 [Cytophagales bacterium]|nr:hypothetical protein [Cytophagales bacterium]
MKRLFFSFVIVLFVTSVLGQTPTHDKDYYLEKSDSQKTAGNILVGGGTAMLTLGIIISKTQTQASDASIPDSSGFLILGGLLLDLTSIPFFASSASNARKAATLSSNQKKFENQNESLALIPQENLEYECLPLTSN